MELAEPRQRGMAMLFDIAVLLVIYTGVSFLLPAVIQSDYSDIVKQIDKVDTLHSKQNDLERRQDRQGQGLGARRPSTRPRRT